MHLKLYFVQPFAQQKVSDGSFINVSCLRDVQKHISDPAYMIRAAFEVARSDMSDSISAVNLEIVGPMDGRFIEK